MLLDSMSVCYMPRYYSTYSHCSKEEKGFDAVKEEAEDSDDFNFIRSKSSAEDTPKKKAEPSKLLGLGAAANFAQ